MSKDKEPLQAPDVATETEAPRQLAVLKRGEIVRSKTNPRTHFDAAYIKELATSIREHGILQPILVRPLPGERLQETFEDTPPGAPRPTHEIVCGECRWRACELADVTELPVLIRHLTDLQVLQVQLVENLKRKDLHPLEEAEGFDRLMTDHHLTVEDIAAKVDKSVSQIYVTLKLLDLTPECREELYAGKLNRSTALLVARAPSYLQAKIAKDIMAVKGDGDTMSYREAVRHIQQNYMLQLAHAVFNIKDETLVPKAGSCTTCAKNTGANADMFDDVKGGDTCTDPKCFDSKKVAHFAQVAKAAQAKGQKVIQGKEAKELIAYEGATPTGYMRLDQKDYINGRTQSLRNVVGKDCPTPVMIIDPFTKQAVEVLPVDVANKLLKQAESHGKKTKEPTAQDLEQQFADAWQAKAIEQIHAAAMAGKAKGITVALARRIALFFADNLFREQRDRFARLFNIENAQVGLRDAVEDFLIECEDSLVGPALLVLLSEGDLDQYKGEMATLHMIAEDSGVDLQAIQAEVKAEMLAAAAAKADTKATPASKPAGKGKAKKLKVSEAQDAISQALQAAETLSGDQGGISADGPLGEALQALYGAGITSLDILADMTVDELTGLTDLSESDATAVITQARSSWFPGGATSGTEPAADVAKSATEPAWPFPTKRG